VATKKIIINEPKENDISVYNYPDDYTTTPAVYNESVGLPNNNDKFQEKDLYTNSVGSELNNAIIERNLKAQGTDSKKTFIRIDNLYISAYASSDDTTNNRIEVFLFSDEKQTITPNASYNTIKNLLDTEKRIFRKDFSDKSGGDLGNITDLEGSEIIFDFGLKYDDNGNKISAPQLGNFSGRNTSYNIIDSLKTKEDLPNLNLTTIIDENIQNPLYLIIRTRGDQDQWIGTDVRKRKYLVYKINNTDLFDYNGDNVFPKVTYFSTDTNLTKIVDVEGDGGGYDNEKPAWTVGDLKLTISTNDFIPNEWDDGENVTSEDEKQYERFFVGVQPGYLIDNFISDIDLLSISFDRQLGNNNDSPGPEFNQTDTYQDFIVKSNISTVNLDNQLNTNIDLQNYYENDLNKSLFASSPSTVGLTFTPIDINEEELQTKFFYFVINWNDKDSEIQTLDDWQKIRPTELSDLQDLQNTNNLYKVYNNDNNNSIPTNTYSTPGIKNIKIILISYDEETRQLGRWKLVTSRIFLDIPINQYPDFSELGGSDYTTIPWPYTTALIGGISEESKYYKSIVNTLGGGKIGNTDIIDEKFLIQSRDNTELGKTIEKMDLEQVRYFNDSYNIYDLLNISILTQELNTTPEYLSTLPFPEYFEEFDINQDENIDVLDILAWGNEGRTDIATYILDNSTEGIFATELLENGNGLEQPITNFFNPTNIPLIKHDNQNYYDGVTNKFSEESSVGQIFISDNQDLKLKQDCKIEINTGELSNNSIYDSSGNSNKGLLIGDYKIKKTRKGEQMRRDSFIKVPKKTNNTNGAL
jgi:hypothetical protein